MNSTKNIMRDHKKYIASMLYQTLKRLILISFVPLTFFSFIVQAADPQKDWRVLTEQAQCLIVNLQAYRQSKSQPVVIFLNACPIVDQAEALRKIQKNNGALPEVRESSEKPLDDVIVYTETELKCLEGFSIEKNVEVVELPAKPCVK